MTKIAVVGSNGFIARQIIPWFEAKNYEVIKISHTTKENCLKLDLSNCEAFDFSALKNVNYIIFTAAISSLDVCENDFEMSYKINVIGTRYFIKNAVTMGCKVLFFSSDAVYGADDGEYFTEKSILNPISQYGKMKQAIELEFAQEQAFKAIRLSYVFSYYDKFTQYYLSCIEKKKMAEIFHPFYRSVIAIDDLMLLIERILERWDILTAPVVNACGKELVSRIRIVDCINRVINKGNYYNVIRMPENLLNIRPCITCMKSLYMNDLLINHSISFEEKVKAEIEKYL